MMATFGARSQQTESPVMLDSYLFVPGDKPRFLNKMKELKADYYVIDLEDSVSISNKAIALDNSVSLTIDNSAFVRIPIKERVYSEDQILGLIRKFNGRVVLPKVSTRDDLREFLAIHDSSFPLKLILLVENPRCFINVCSIAEEYGSQLHGIGFGSHDFCAAMGMKHDFEHLRYYRKQLVLVSKAHGLAYVDGVDTNIRDLSGFVEDCKYAFDAGADGKFVIHPDQLKQMDRIEYLSSDELAEMKRVSARMGLISREDIDVLEIDGKIYEKPHLARIARILDRLAKRGA
jgi:citrate lyase beta subunit